MAERIAKFAPSLIEAALTACFLCWAAAFIWKSSIPLYSGGRTFCLFDDAMISMRYAENAASGNGPVWNAGERVEGYTNPLMVGLMTLVLRVCAKPAAVLAIQILGALLVTATAFLSVRVYTGMRGRDQGLPGWLLLPFLFGIYTLSFWAIMGMETGLVALFLTMGVIAAMPPAEGQTPSLRSRSALLGIACAGLYLSRPDALAYAVVLVGCFGLTRRRSELPWLLPPVLTVACVVGAHALFRFVYYGTLLPNTATLKLGLFPVGARLSGGIGFVVPFLQDVFPLFMLAAFSSIARRRSHGALILSVFAVSVAYQVYVGGDPWEYWRIMSPTLPLLVVLAADGAFLAADRVFVNSRNRFAVSLLTALLMVWAVSSYNRPFIEELLLIRKPYQTDAAIANVNAAYAIKDLTKPSASVGAFWAGSIPFYSERYALDFLGKSDPRIAKMEPDLSGAVAWSRMRSVPGHNKYDLRYSIVERQPTYIQGTTWGSDDVSGWAADRYVSVVHQGARLLLLKGSPDVLWDRLAE